VTKTITCYITLIDLLQLTNRLNYYKHINGMPFIID